MMTNNQTSIEAMTNEQLTAEVELLNEKLDTVAEGVSTCLQKEADRCSEKLHTDKIIRNIGIGIGCAAAIAGGYAIFKMVTSKKNDAIDEDGDDDDDEL